MAARPARAADNLRSRVEFARAMATVQPGMTADRVREILGEPEDIRTERDPGGIAAARTTEVWRYGTNGHLTCATLGQVHLMADRTVQYAFGGEGAPPPADLFTEPELRALLRTLDRVPSYFGGQYNPRRVIAAVNALHPLGKDKAVAAIAEYLRVTSWLDDPGREGVFFVLRSLFDVPADPGHLPPMMVGASSPPAPTDPTTLPRFPLQIVGDIPWYISIGYSLAGQAESPEHHLAWFRDHGVMRARPLRPVDDPIALVNQLVGAPGAAFVRKVQLDHAYGRAHIMNQALWLVDTVHREPRDVFGARFGIGDGDMEPRWQRIVATFARDIEARWDPAGQRYTDRGRTLAPESNPIYQREIWPLALGPGDARLILERRDARYVTIEIRIQVPAGESSRSGVLRIVDAGDASRELARIDVAGRSSPGSSSSGSVHSQILELAAGGSVRAELDVGRNTLTSPVLAP